MITSPFRNQFLLWVVFISFGSIYCLISLVNHYLFRTAALDLGMFNHALYSFANFKHNYFTLDLSGAEVNYFGDHFSPLTYIYVPFYFLFGTYTLLIIQIIAVLFGGYGIYRHALLKTGNSRLSLVLLIHFFSIWGIYSALSFDFHNNVVAAMLVPWLIYFYDKADKKKCLLIIILMLSAKENMALWVAFIFAGIIVKNGVGNFRRYLKFEIPVILFSALWFLIIVGFVMPSINYGQGTNQLARYSFLGNDLTQIVSTIFTKPFYVLSLFFNNPLPDEIANGIKAELHFMVLVSGGILFIFKPYYLVMLIPIYAQKLLTNDFGFWGINGHYSIEFVPLLSLALIECVTAIASSKNRYIISSAFAFLTLLFTIVKIDHRRSQWYNSVNVKFYSIDHYRTTLQVNKIHEALKIIPAHATLSVTTHLAPHLAFREKIYHFPVIKDAEYLVLLTSNQDHYPLSEEEFIKKTGELRSDENYIIEYDDGQLLILKKLAK